MRKIMEEQKAKAKDRERLCKINNRERFNASVREYSRRRYERDGR